MIILAGVIIVNLQNFKAAAEECNWQCVHVRMCALMLCIPWLCIPQSDLCVWDYHGTRWSICHQELDCKDAVSHAHEPNTENHYCWLINLSFHSRCLHRVTDHIHILMCAEMKHCTRAERTHMPHKKKVPANWQNDCNVMYRPFVRVQRVKSQPHINGLASVQNSWQIWAVIRAALLEKMTC